MAVPGVQAVGSIVTPPLPGESAWIQCAYYHLETRAFGYVKDSKGNMFVFPSGLTASERSIRNTADGVPCPCREEHLVGVFLVETGSIVADQTFLSLFPASIETVAAPQLNEARVRGARRGHPDVPNLLHGDVVSLSCRPRVGHEQSSSSSAPRLVEQLEQTADALEAQ